MALDDRAAAREELSRARELLGPVSTIVLLEGCCAVADRCFDEARAAWAELKGINPDYSFALHRSRMPFRTGREADLIEEGLRKAGVLDGQGA